MSPVSGPVLGCAGVVSAPALWKSLVTGTAPIDHGLLHFLVAVLVCWCALSAVSALVGPAPTRADPADGRADATAPAETLSR